MSSQLRLIKAIRKGRLADVRVLLDTGISVGSDGDQDDSAMYVGIACFMGNTDIVRELVRRGAAVNMADNNDPTSPLSMAIRGGRTEVVRTLIELGAVVPGGMETGLGEQDILLAQWKASRDGCLLAPIDESLMGSRDFDEIDVSSCVGIDTQALEEEMLRLAASMR